MAGRFSNRRARCGATELGHVSYLNPNPRRIACQPEHPERTWADLGRKVIYENEGTLFPNPRRISTNMNSNRDVAVFMHTGARPGKHRTYVCVNPPDSIPAWWDYCNNRINRYIPMIAEEDDVPSPQPMSDIAVHSMRLDSGMYLYHPGWEYGKKWVWDLRVYENPGPIGEFMQWNRRELSGVQISYTNKCTRFFLWKNVIVQDNRFTVAGGSPIPLANPIYTLRQSRGPKSNLDSSSPHYDPTKKTRLFPPCNFTDAVKQDLYPEYDLTNQMLDSKFAPSWFVCSDADPEPPPPHNANFHKEEFANADLLRISGKKLYQMMRYAVVHWSVGNGGERWPGGIPQKAFDLYLCVNFYDYTIYEPRPNGNGIATEWGFAGAYGTAYVIY